MNFFILRKYALNFSIIAKDQAIARFIFNEYCIFFDAKKIVFINLLDKNVESNKWIASNLNKMQMVPNSIYLSKDDEHSYFSYILPVVQFAYRLVSV